MNKKILTFTLIGFLLFFSVSVISAFSWKELFTGKATVAASSNCNDTDRGINYNIPGTVIIKKIFTQKYSDSCSGNSGKLLERYCSSKGALQTKVYKCPNGCKDGACIPTSIVSNKTINQNLT